MTKTWSREARDVALKIIHAAEKGVPVHRLTRKEVLARASELGFFQAAYYDPDEEGHGGSPGEVLDTIYEIILERKAKER